MEAEAEEARGRGLISEPLGASFWSKVERTPTCWNWTGALYWDGYGAVGLRQDGKRLTRRAHRLAYEEAYGPIPDGRVIDHLCRNRRCVNPSHLEAVTPRENTLRGVSPVAAFAVATSCSQGHEYTDETTYTWAAKDGRLQRRCRRCDADRARQRRQLRSRQTAQ